MSQIDHKELAISRLVTQFRESTNLIEYIRALLVESNNLEEVFCDLLEKRWIDTAEGAQLDVLGAIVGQTREFIDAELFDYFGFSVNPISQSFGTINNIGVGGRFKYIDESTEGLRLLTDEEYRVFIRARIMRNSTSSTPENIISQIRFIFNSPLVLLIDGDTEYSVNIGRRLGLNEKSILINTDVIAKTAGVRVNYVTEFNTGNFFGFLGIPGSKGFGSLSDPLSGGELGNLI